MRLKPGSYLILGMLNRGRETGYAIKRAVDRSTRFFWAASFAQVYPELAALEQDGYIAGADEPHGARPRKTHRLTDKGRTALADWLRSDRTPVLEFRDEGLLRLFFADALAPDDALDLVKRLRIHAEQIEHAFRTEILPLASAPAGAFPSSWPARAPTTSPGARAGFEHSKRNSLAAECARGLAAAGSRRRRFRHPHGRTSRA